MSIHNFESEYRTAMDDILNDLQTTVLLVTQLQLKISQISTSIQNLSYTVEDFINEQKEL
jgi:hypothetical protein